MTVWVIPRTGTGRLSKCPGSRPHVRVSLDSDNAPDPVVRHILQMSYFACRTARRIARQARSILQPTLNPLRRPTTRRRSAEPLAMEAHVKLGLQIPSFTLARRRRGDRPDARRGSPARPTTSASTRSGSWTTSSRSGASGRPRSRCSRAGRPSASSRRNTSRARLGLMVGGVHYRLPGLWVKAATTLDVLSGGRAWLGIGAAWNEDESRSLGFPFPPLGERFEMLEETLQIAHEMWQGERGSEAAFDGRQFHAMRLMNSPQSISRPRVPIMIGGGGEKKTLRLVAQYADATNVFGGPEAIAHKYEVLREHCAAVGRELRRDRALDTSRRSTSTRHSPSQIVDRFGELSDAGAQHIIFSVVDVHDPKPSSRRSAGRSCRSSGSCSAASARHRRC